MRRRPDGPFSSFLDLSKHRLKLSSGENLSAPENTQLLERMPRIDRPHLFSAHRHLHLLSTDAVEGVVNRVHHRRHRGRRAGLAHTLRAERVERSGYFVGFQCKVAEIVARGMA